MDIYVIIRPFMMNLNRNIFFVPSQNMCNCGNKGNLTYNPQTGTAKLATVVPGANSSVSPQPRAVPYYQMGGQRILRSVPISQRKTLSTRGTATLGGKH